ncbi:MAG: hypothetical protein RIG61_09805 [Deltaproteobacteria bacterium]
MKRLSLFLVISAFITFTPAVGSLAGESLNIQEFRKLYDSLLSGKTLVTEGEEDGMSVKKERRYGKALDLGDGDFEIPVEQVITYTKDGKTDREITIDIVDMVNDLGGSAMIQEEVRSVTVLEEGDEKPEESKGVEFGGVYRVGKNDKGGFEVNNFSLIPSLKVDGDTLTLAGSMISYSCYPEKERSVCSLTVRDFDVQEYERFNGYKIGEPIGGDFVEVYEEASAAK